MKRTLLFWLCCAVSAHATLTISGPITLTGELQLSGNALTVPNQVTNISPANGATHVSYLPTISWQNGGGALTYETFFDTSNPPTTSVQNSAATTYAPSALSFSTTYYLKINPSNNSGTTTGSVTSFTTEPVFTVDGYMPYAVAGSDGDTLTEAALNASDVISMGTWAFDTVAASVVYAGGTYKIISAGTTDFTTVGASSNAVGTEFVATGTPSPAGTGVCSVPRKFVSNEPNPLYSPFKNGSTIYPGNTATTAVKFGMDTWGNTATVPLTTPVTTFTMGFWMKFGDVAAVNPDAPDLVQIRHTGSNWMVVGWKPSGNYFYFENGPLGTSTNVNGIVPNTWYWITIRGGVSGTAGQTNDLKVYAADGTTLIGSATFDCSGGTPGNYNAIEIGRLDQHHASNQPPTTSYIIYSEMGVNTSTLTFPLGP